MTKDERERFNKLYGLMEVFLEDRADPKNGWKTARAVFEQKTTDSLDTITEKISCLPSMQEEINLNTIHRTKYDSHKWTRTQKIATVGPTLAAIGLLLAHFI